MDFFCNFARVKAILKGMAFENRMIDYAILRQIRSLKQQEDLLKQHIVLPIEGKG